MNHFVFTLLTFSMFLFSCKKEDCSNVLPPPNWIELGITDSAGNALLWSGYNKDSFRLYNSSREIYLGPLPYGDSSRLQIRFPDLVNELDYYLELSSTDTDTLRFDITNSVEKCFTSYSLDKLYYNGVLGSNLVSGGIYDVVKGG